MTEDGIRYCLCCYLELRRVFHDPLRPKGAWADAKTGSIGCLYRPLSLGYRQVHLAGPAGGGKPPGVPPRPVYIPQ